MISIVFLDSDTIGPSVAQTRPQNHHTWRNYPQTTADQVVERLQGATVAVVNKVPLRRETLTQLPNLKFIAVTATGYDIIDIAACRDLGIEVSNVRGYAIKTVPEHTIAMILALRRCLFAYRQDVINGEWQKADKFCLFNHPIRDLSGSRLGIIGEGVIGKAVARLAQALGMIPMFAAHRGWPRLGTLYNPFEEVLETADIITLHAPLTPNTHNILSELEFRRMARKPLIINTARGGLVSEIDLVKALDEGQISGIGFDVLTSEPPSDNHPLMAIADRPNVIITPHVAWASEEAMQALWNQVVENIDAFLNGVFIRTLT